MQPPPYGSVSPYGGLRPLGIGEILDNAIQVYRKNFAALVAMVAVAVVPIQIVSVLINLSSRPSSHGDAETIGGIRFGSTSTDGHDAAVRLGASLVVVLLSLIAGRLAVGACTRGVADAYLGGVKADAGASLRVALHSLGSLLWLELLVLPALIIGLALCIAPGIWLWTSWLVATPVLLVEGARGTNAMRRSFQLVRPRWWPTFGLGVVAVLLTLVISSALNLVLIAVIFSTRDTTSTAYIVIAGILGTISSLISTPLVASAYVILYFDLRVRSEGLDLQMVLASLDSPETPAPVTPGFTTPPVPGQWSPPSGGPRPRRLLLRRPWPRPPAATATAAAASPGRVS